MGEIIFLIILALAGAGMFGMSFGFQVSRIDTSGGPALFPRVVIIILFVFIVIRIVMISKNKEEMEKKFHFLEIFQGSRLIFLLLFLGYALLMKPFGFVISSSLFLILAVTFLYRKQYGERITVKKGLILYPVILVSVAALYYIFVNKLNVLLPSGILNF